MMRLAWEKRKPLADGRMAGMPVLLLAVLVLFSLNVAFNSREARKDLCCEDRYAQIEGDVRRPGVYSFCSKINLAGLIERGGGLAHGNYRPSDFNYILLESGVRVTIERSDEGWTVSRDGMSAFYKITLGIPISLNSESEEGLTAVPGIGPKLAGSILRERNKRGGFKSLGEIRDVYGIGDKLYERIIPYVRL
jgi:competence protein ComEA